MTAGQSVLQIVRDSHKIEQKTAEFSAFFRFDSAYLL